MGDEGGGDWNGGPNGYWTVFWEKLSTNQQKKNKKKDYVFVG